MNQTYVYRKHLRVPFKFLMLCSLVILVGIILLIFGFIITNDPKITGYELLLFGIGILAVYLFTLFELGIIYVLVYKRFKAISILLTEDAIVYSNSKSKVIIPFEDIKKLEFPSIKYTGGWMKIVYRGGNIRLTVVLEHIGDFICELKEKLNEREMLHTYNVKKMFSFYKTAVFSDESWDRLYQNYKLQLITHYICIILTTVILLLDGNSSNNIIFILGSLVTPLLGYLISEIIIGNQVKKRIDKENFRLLQRNIKFEQKVFKISFMGFSIGYLLIMLVVIIFI